MTGLTIAALAAVSAMTPASAVEDDAAARPETVLVAEFEVKDEGVNATDDAEVASLAREATRLFRERVEEDGRFTLVGAGAQAGASGGEPGSGHSPCRTSACTREAARSAGATRVIRGRYVKVSNLIRYLAVELVDPSTGRVLRSAAAELKGRRDAILDRAVANLYEHIHPRSPERSRRAGG